MIDCLGKKAVYKTAHKYAPRSCLKNDIYAHIGATKKMKRQIKCY